MKIVTKALLMLIMASIFLTGFAAADEISLTDNKPTPGAIPEIGSISAPANTTDVSAGLGIFSKIGQFFMDYAIHIAVFVSVLAIVVLSTRGSWARSNQKSEEAAESRRNMKELIQDNLWTIVALMVVFYIFAPFIKSFIQG
ncbi:MAG: hypothetical protein PHU60_04400 [Tissierellia bacterium]|nr:hypothetical protein [Tissierellia bacterium]